MLSVIMLSIVMLSVIMLSIVMLSVIMLSNVMLSCKAFLSDLLSNLTKVVFVEYSPQQKLTKSLTKCHYAECRGSIFNIISNQN